MTLGDGQVDYDQCRSAGDNVDGNRLNSQPIPDDKPSLGWEMVERGSGGPNLSKALQMALVGFAALAVVGGAFIMQRDAAPLEQEEAAPEPEEEQLSDNETFFAWLETLDPEQASGDAQLFVRTVSAFRDASETDVFTTSVETSENDEGRAQFCFGTDVDTLCGEVTAPQWDGQNIESFRYNGERIVNVLLRPTRTVVPDMMQVTYYGLLTNRQWHVVADVNVENLWLEAREDLTFGLFLLETSNGTAEAARSPFVFSELSGPWDTTEPQQWDAWMFDIRNEPRNFVFSVNGEQYDVRVDTGAGETETTTVPLPVVNFGNGEEDGSASSERPEAFVLCEPYAQAAISVLETSSRYGTSDISEIEAQMFEDGDEEDIDVLYSHVLQLANIVESDDCTRTTFARTAATIVEDGYSFGNDALDELMSDPAQWTEYYDEIVMNFTEVFSGF